MTGIRMRDYRPADLPGCMAVFDTNVPLFFREHERAPFEAFLLALPGPYLVLEDDEGQVVGCGGYAVVAEDGRADLCWGMVRADLQRGGLGRLLTEARLRHATVDPRVRTVAINTSQHTVGFYERLGFRVLEVVPDGYAPGLDRCEMRWDVSMTPSSPKLYDGLAYLWSVFSAPDEYTEEAETFHGRLQREGIPDGGTLLHLGSGGGSLDFHLKKWYRITGVDRSPAMIEQASACNPEVDYVIGDIRSVRLGRDFDAVLVHDAISYMTSTAELEEVYRTAAAHLGRGGVLLGLPEELRGRLQERDTNAWTRRSGDLILSVMESSYDRDPEDHEFEVVYVFLIRQGDDLRIEVDRHRNGVFELEEFLAAVRSAGFDAAAEKWELSDWGGEPEMPLIVGVRNG